MSIATKTGIELAPAFDRAERCAPTWLVTHPLIWVLGLFSQIIKSGPLKKNPTKIQIVYSSFGMYKAV